MKPYIITIQKYWYLFLLILLVMPVILAILLKPVPNYTISTGLWLEQPLYFDTSTDQTNILNLTSARAQNYADSLTSLLNSHDFLVQIRDQLKEYGYSFSPTVSENLLGFINRGTKLTVAGDSLLLVNYSGDDSQLAIAIVKSITKVYTNFVQQTFLSSGQSMIIFIEDQVNRAKSDLDKAELEAKAYLSNHPDLSNTSNTQSFISEDELQRSLLLVTRDQAQDRYDTLNSNLEQLKMGYDKTVKGLSNLIIVRDAPAIVKTNVINYDARVILGASIGLASGILVVVMVVLLLTWGNSSLFTTNQTSRLLGLKLVTELPFTDFKSINNSNYPSRQYKSQLFRRNLLILFLGAGFMVLVVFLSYRNPPNGIVVPIIALLIILIYKNPAIGFSLGVFLVLACELYPSPDIFSEYTTIPMRNFNSFTTLSLSITPLELILGWTVFCVMVHRARIGTHILNLTTTNVLIFIFFGFLVYSYIWGVILNHGDSKAGLVEIRALLYVVIVYLLALHFVRNRQMWRVLDWIIPIGLTFLSLTTVIRFGLLVNTDAALVAESLSGFNHDNAILFVILVMWCLTKVAFGINKAQKMSGLIFMVLPFVGIMVSGRRAAFASLAICIIVFLAILFIRQRKTFFVLVAIMLVIVPPYMIVFKNASGPLGLAARAFNSSSASVGSRDYSSDLYRLIEKNNVRLTIREAPITGKGFGQQFTRYNPLVDLEVFQFQYFTPHVQVLWLWLKLGVIGWVVFWLLICGALFRLGQIVKYEQRKLYLNVAITAGSIITAIMVYAYLDISLVNARLMTILAVSIGLLETGYSTMQKSRLNLIHDKELILNKHEAPELETKELIIA